MTDKEIADLKAENEQLKQENERLAKRICELQSDLSREKSTVEWLRRCSNCIHRFVFHYSQAGTCKKPACRNYSEWCSDFQFLERMKSLEEKE